MKKNCSDPTEPLNDWIPHGSTHLPWQAFDKTASLFSWGMIPDPKIKKTEGRKGQKELSPRDSRKCIENEDWCACAFIKPKGSICRCLAWLILSLNWWQMICRRGTNTFKSSNVHFSVFLSQLSPDMIIANLQSSCLMPGWSSGALWMETPMASTQKMGKLSPAWELLRQKGKESTESNPANWDVWFGANPHKIQLQTAPTPHGWGLHTPVQGRKQQELTAK